MELCRPRLIACFLAVGSCASPAFADLWPARADEHRDLFNSEFRRSGLSEVYKPLLAAQIEQESSWRADASSKFADGLTQFTPPTVETANNRWSADLAGLGGAENPRWAIRAQMLMMARSIRRAAKRGTPDRVGRFGISAREYNGGEGYINRERRSASAAGVDPSLYENLIPFCLDHRAEWACDENLGYLPHIVRRAPKYTLF